MKNEKETNLLLLGVIVGSLVGVGVAIYFSSKFISKTRKNLRERRHKFYEGIDDIFDTKLEEENEEDSRIDKDTEEGIIDELFSRTN
jgi:gas vesicle protein